MKPTQFVAELLGFDLHALCQVGAMKVFGWHNVRGANFRFRRIASNPDKHAIAIFEALEIFAASVAVC